MNTYTEPHFLQSALITIDTQNDFTQQNAPACIPGTREVVPNIVRLLTVYRAHQLPIIHVVRLYLPDGKNVDPCRRKNIEGGQVIAAPGTTGAELVTELKPSPIVSLDAASLLRGQFQLLAPQEYAVYKSRWGAFYQTNLLEFLQTRHIDTVVFCGCNFPNCPRTSIYEASERDFRVVLVQDAISQLTTQGEQELRNIDVQILSTGACEQQVQAAFHGLS